MGEAMETDGVARLHDAPQQPRVTPGLVPQAEPGGLGLQIRAKGEGSLRGQGQAAFETV